MITIITIMAIIVPTSFVVVVDDTQKHVDYYADFSVSTHDNIDDESDSHSHSHKHSDDGEEHEHNHNHEHKNIIQSVYEVARIYDALKIKVPSNESINGSVNHHLISDPHFQDIFRPPIG